MLTGIKIAWERVPDMFEAVLMIVAKLGAQALRVKGIEPCFMNNCFSSRLRVLFLKHILHFIFQMAEGRLTYRTTDGDASSEPSKKKRRVAVRVEKPRTVADHFKGADISSIKEVGFFNFNGNRELHFPFLARM